jgi:thiamine-phosphate pyrophosphorylase
MGEQINQGKQIESAVLRILDANLDRAREGLRIIEEWGRFGLDDEQTINACKQMRQALAKWHTQTIRNARDTERDRGTQITHPQEAQRQSLEQLLSANFARTQEALRVLEEYSKLYNTEMAAACKQMRYQVYILETHLLTHHRHRQLEQAQLYLVTSPVENLVSIVEAALQGGLNLVQYRNKNADDTQKIKEAQQLCQLCHAYDALFLVNDRPDLALAVDADGVHLGQQDLPVAVAREILGSQRIIGQSTTNPDELQKAIQAGADYVGVGPVFETPTKPGKAAAGFDYLQYAHSHCPVPWFAIGGIDVNNINEVLDNQTKRVAVVRAIMEAEQPMLVTQYFLAQLSRIRAPRLLEPNLLN